MPYTTSSPTERQPVPYDPQYPNDSYFLLTMPRTSSWPGSAKEPTRSPITFKATVGARYSKTKYSFNTLTGGPQLFNAPAANSGDKNENSFTPKVNLSYQMDPQSVLLHLCQGLPPGGANNPVP
jgi:iron complex outermembrane recepter protein